MNPFVCPENIYISTRPKDMRAGINTLAQEIEGSLGHNPLDGSLYVFMSKNHKRIKMLSYEDGIWCMWTLLPTDKVFRFHVKEEHGFSVEVDRVALLMLLSGLNPSAALYGRLPK